MIKNPGKDTQVKFTVVKREHHTESSFYCTTPGQVEKNSELIFDTVDEAISHTRKDSSLVAVKCYLRV